MDASGFVVDERDWRSIRTAGVGGRANKVPTTGDPRCFANMLSCE
jgi:hypothetical protein